MKNWDVRAFVCFGFIMLSLSACVADKTEQDWRDSQSQAELAKIATVAGTYRGAVYSVQDGSYLGSLAVSIASDTSLQSSGDNLSIEQKPNAIGAISYSGLTQVDVVYNQGFYKTGFLKIVVNIVDSNNISHAMALTANVANERLIGKLEAVGFPAFGGRVILTKNAAFENNQPSIFSGRLKQLSESEGQFAGTWQVGDAAVRSVKMFIREGGILPQQKFLSVFLPIRYAEVKINFGAYDLEFHDAQLDEQNQTLSGSAQISDSGSGSKFVAQLMCHYDSSLVAWKCLISGEGSKNASILFYPVSEGK